MSNTTETPATAAPMSIADAAELLRFKGTRRTAERRLRRYLLAKEQFLNEQIMIRTASEDGVRVRYFVTLPLLRQHCPEFFNARVEAEEHLRERFDEITEKLVDLERRDEALARHILAERRR
jgi:hypothetical protein